MFALSLGAYLVPAHGGELLKLTIEEYTFNAEVADTPAQRATGLSGRSRLTADTAMLFVFEQSLRPQFWMRDTAVPLTIAFLDGDGRIVDMRDMTPYSLRLHVPRQPVRYALEMRQGWFNDRRIGKGTRVLGLERLPRANKGLTAPETP